MTTWFKLEPVGGSRRVFSVQLSGMNLDSLVTHATKDDDKYNLMPAPSGYSISEGKSVILNTNIKINRHTGEWYIEDNDVQIVMQKTMGIYKEKSNLPDPLF